MIVSAVHPIFRDPSIPWAVDMDGTIIREDVTITAIQMALRNPFLWHLILHAVLLWLVRRSIACCERFLETRSSLTKHPSMYTYNENLLNAIRDHRLRGGRAILATASHVRAAEPIARYVGVFDIDDDDGGGGILGSDPSFLSDIIKRNDEGKKKEDDDKNGAGIINDHSGVLDARANVKARLLSDRFGGSGGRGFIYAGNSADDLHVWRHDDCKAMLLVNCSPTVLHTAIRTIRKPFLVLF